MQLCLLLLLLLLLSAAASSKKKRGEEGRSLLLLLLSKGVRCLRKAVGCLILQGPYLQGCNVEGVHLQPSCPSSPTLGLTSNYSMLQFMYKKNADKEIKPVRCRNLLLSIAEELAAEVLALVAIVAVAAPVAAVVVAAVAAVTAAVSAAAAAAAVVANERAPLAAGVAVCVVGGASPTRKIPRWQQQWPLQRGQKWESLGSLT
uniref:Uncharacterized protein n=1 Tax=Dunaliella tertiolecta TaxID=3047 RepID=A0A7S3VTR4_DUNTE